LPEAAIIAIWRELVGAVSLLQTGIKVTVSSGPGDAHCWDMAKNYFGTVLPMVKASAASMAVVSVRENDANFAVLPWPQDGEQTAWWPFLLNQKEDKMRIVCALPYGVQEDQVGIIQNRALVISKTDFAPSGEDHSFLVLEIDLSVSRARILDVFKSVDLKLLTLNTRQGAGAGGKNLHFIEVDDYISEKDKQLERVEEKLAEAGAKCIALGGYSLPPIFKKKDSQKSASDKQNSKSEEKTGT
jgi:hypothetical protein